MFTKLRRLLTDVNFKINQNRGNNTLWLNFLHEYIEEYKAELYYYYTGLKINRDNIKYIFNPHEHVSGELRVLKNTDYTYPVYIHTCLKFYPDTNFEMFYCQLLYLRGFGIILCDIGDSIGVPCIFVIDSKKILEISKLKL